MEKDSFSNSFDEAGSFISTRLATPKFRTSANISRRKTLSRRERNTPRSRKNVRDRDFHYRKASKTQLLTSATPENVEEGSTFKNDSPSKKNNEKKTAKNNTSIMNLERTVKSSSSTTTIFSTSSRRFSKVITKIENNQSETEKISNNEKEKITEISKKIDENIFFTMKQFSIYDVVLAGFSSIVSSEFTFSKTPKKTSNKKKQTTIRKNKKKLYKNASIMINSKSEKNADTISKNFVTASPTFDHQAMNAWLQEEIEQITKKTQKILIKNEKSALNDDAKKTNDSNHFQSIFTRIPKRKKPNKLFKEKIRAKSEFQKFSITNGESQESVKKKKMNLKNLSKKNRAFIKQEARVGMKLSSLNDEPIAFEFNDEMLMIERMIIHFHFYARFYIDQNAEPIQMKLKSSRSIRKKTKIDVVKTWVGYAADTTTNRTYFRIKKKFYNVLIERFCYLKIQNKKNETIRKRSPLYQFIDCIDTTIAEENV